MLVISCLKCFSLKNGRILLKHDYISNQMVITICMKYWPTPQTTMFHCLTKELQCWVSYMLWINNHLHDTSVNENCSVNDGHQKRVHGGLFADGQERPQKDLVPEKPMVHAAKELLSKFLEIVIINQGSNLQNFLRQIN